MYVYFVVYLPVGVIAVVALMMGSVLDREVHPNANVAGCQLASNVANCTMTSDDDYYDRKIRVATAVSFICGLFLVSQFFVVVFSFLLYAVIGNFAIQVCICLVLSIDCHDVPPLGHAV